MLRRGNVINTNNTNFPACTGLSRHTRAVVLGYTRYRPLLQLRERLLRGCTGRVVSAFRVVNRAINTGRIVVNVGGTCATAVRTMGTIVKRCPRMELKLLSRMCPTNSRIILVCRAANGIMEPNKLPVRDNMTMFGMRAICGMCETLGRGAPIRSGLMSMMTRMRRPVAMHIPVKAPLRRMMTLTNNMAAGSTICFINKPVVNGVKAKTRPIAGAAGTVLILPGSRRVVRGGLGGGSVSVGETTTYYYRYAVYASLYPERLLKRPVRPGGFVLTTAYGSMRRPGVFVGALFYSSYKLYRVCSYFRKLSPEDLVTRCGKNLHTGKVHPPGMRTGPMKPRERCEGIPVRELVTHLSLAECGHRTPLSRSTIPIGAMHVLLDRRVKTPTSTVIGTNSVMAGKRVVTRPKGKLDIKVRTSIGNLIARMGRGCVIVRSRRKHTNGRWNC